MSMEEQKPRREEVCPSKRDQLDLETARARIEQTQGPEFWRSLEELAGSDQFREMMHREFPKGASEWVDAVSRRGFMKLMGASLAMAGMTACTKQPLEPIVPYVKQPEELVPGRPMFFATAFELGGYASPVLVESHMYRPTKIEGNEQHPASLGGTDVYAQASILGMYDPDRSQTITYMGDVRTWGSFVSAIRGPLNVQKGLQGRGGVRLLTQTISSPTLADQIKSFLQVYPEAKWHAYEPINRDNVLEGAKLAFAQPVETRYDFEKADVILSLDADFLAAGFPGSIDFREGLALVRAKEKKLFIDETGRVVITPQFDIVHDFFEGVAAVNIGETRIPNLGLISNPGKWGYIDKAGKLVLSLRFTHAEDFSEGLAGVRDGDRGGFIDHTGKFVFDVPLDVTLGFHEGVVGVLFKGAVTYVDRRGKKIPTPVDYGPKSNSFSEGLVPVSIKGKWGFMDPSGKMAIEPQFEDAENFSEGLAPVKVQSEETVWCPADKSGNRSGATMMWGYIDRTGKTVIPAVFNSAEPFSEGWRPSGNATRLTLLTKAARQLSRETSPMHQPFQEAWRASRH